MPTRPLENYLRMYRKRSGLTQREVAFLLGCENGAQVSRYEKRRRVPPLQTALAYEAIFGIPVAELFAGIRQTAERTIQRRLTNLEKTFQSVTAKGSKGCITAQKLRWLEGRKGRVFQDVPSTP